MLSAQVSPIAFVDEQPAELLFRHKVMRYLQTETQLELAIMDLRAQIAHLVEALHDFGPSGVRATQLTYRR